MPTQVIMPQMGESVVEGTVSQWLKQAGDTVAEFEPIVEVETDKVTSEIPSPAAGVLLKVYVPAGETVKAGVMLAVIGQAGEAVPEVPTTQPAAAPAARAASTQAGNGRSGDRPHVTPVVARIAAEHDIDLRQVRGTGRNQRVTKKDILAFIEAQPEAPWSAADPDLLPWEQPGSGDLFKPTDDLYRAASVGPAEAVTAAVPETPLAAVPRAAGDELVPLSKMRQRIAEHMVVSKLHTAPHVTTVFEVDMSTVVVHREVHNAGFTRRGVRLTFTAYFFAAAAQALRYHPRVNSQWTADGILLKGEVNLGMATAIDEGLIVPVLKRVDDHSLLGIARRINDLAERARQGALSPDDVSGGTFTITNHGVSGSLFATPIINQPQTAILGVGAIQKRVVVLEGDAVAVRPMVYLSLTFDHRVLDGAEADAFMATLKHILENWSD